MTWTTGILQKHYTWTWDLTCKSAATFLGFGLICSNLNCNTGKRYLPHCYFVFRQSKKNNWWFNRINKRRKWGLGAWIHSVDDDVDDISQSHQRILLQDYYYQDEYYISYVWRSYKYRKCSRCAWIDGRINWELESAAIFWIIVSDVK